MARGPNLARSTKPGNSEKVVCAAGTLRHCRDRSHFGIRVPRAGLAAGRTRRGALPNTVEAPGSSHRRPRTLSSVPGMDVAWGYGSWGPARAGEERLADSRS